MASFDICAIVAVPFPDSDRPSASAVRRSSLPLETGRAITGSLSVMGIASAANRKWDSGLPISDLASAGLPLHR